MGLAGCAGSQRSESPTVRIDSIRSSDGSVKTMNQSQLEGLVQGMADTLSLGVAQATHLLEEQAKTPIDRRAAHALKHLSTTSAVEIAVSPSPEVALLDLLVLSRLLPVAVERRMADPGSAAVIQEHGADFVNYARRIEADLWRDASRMLDDEQKDELRELIDTWLAEHPRVFYVFQVRLSDFTDMRDTRSAKTASGLLAEVGNATRAVDDARLLAERLLWYASRVPMLVGNQVEFTLYDLADQPETQSLIADSTRFTDIAGELAVDFHNLPAQLAEQRELLAADLQKTSELAISQVMNGLTEQREAMMADFDAHAETARGVLVDLRQTIEAANALVNTVDEVVSRFDAGERDPNRAPLDITKVRDAAVEAGIAADELTELLVVAQGLLASPDWSQRASQIDAAWGRLQEGGNSWITLGFRQTLMAMGVFFLGLVAYRVVAVKLVK